MKIQVYLNPENEDNPRSWTYTCCLGYCGVANWLRDIADELERLGREK